MVTRDSNRKYPRERTVPLRQIVFGEHSPGRLLKMQESEIIHRIADLATHQPKVFQIVESTNLRNYTGSKEVTGCML